MRLSLSSYLFPVNGNSDNLQQRLIQSAKTDNEQFIKSSQLVNQFNQNAKYIDQYPEVSIWRTLFVANEYCELSAYRRVSTSFHLFILLIVLQVSQSPTMACQSRFGQESIEVSQRFSRLDLNFRLYRTQQLFKLLFVLLNDKSIISILSQCAGFENLAKADLEMSLSSSDSQRYVTSSFSSRFVVGSLAFLVIVLINYAFTKYYLESFVCDKISEFVDFCSVSNVSKIFVFLVFLLLERISNFFFPVVRHSAGLFRSNQKILVDARAKCLISYVIIVDLKIYLKFELFLANYAIVVIGICRPENLFMTVHQCAVSNLFKSICSSCFGQ